MNYWQISPPDYLKNYVKWFWVCESTAEKVSSFSFKTVVDGAPGILYQPADKGLYYQNDKLMAELTLYGQATTPAEIRLDGVFKTIGINFYPNGLKSVFGINAEQLTDICLDLNEMAEKDGFYLSERLNEEPTTARQIDLLSSYLFFLVRRNSSRAESSIDYAIAQILRSNGNISLKKLQDELCLSQRTVERKFKQHVGVSAKLFARICRFQSSLNQIQNSDYSKLTDIAYDNEYADQSHLIRSFREFAGIAPNEFQKRRRKSENDKTGSDPIAGTVLFSSSPPDARQ